MLTDLSDVEAIVSGADQQAKDRQTAVMAKSGKRTGNGGVQGHADNITNSLVM